MSSYTYIGKEHARPDAAERIVESCAALLDAEEGA